MRIRVELPGHITNRLQAALWREAYWLVEQGVVSVADIDLAISSGPGLRWALLGPFATQHLSGGDGGIAHVLEHLGPPMVEWWATMEAAEWTPELRAAVVAGVDGELDGIDQRAMADERDRLLEQLVVAKARAHHLPHITTRRHRPMSWDLDSLVAIDTHVHVEQDAHGCCSLDQELMDASAAYFKGNDNRTPTVGDLATYYRERRIGAVVFTVDSTTAMGHPALSSEEIIDLAAEHDDILIPFASVDPLADGAPARVRSLVAHGARGFKFHPSLQQFEPNDVRYYPIYEAIADAGLPTVFHTGQTGIGAGLPGGRGIKLRYSDPMLLDDVAADFPTLTVILAHPSVPWQDSAISMATHKANVYIDLSGWLPKYFPPQLVRAANTMLREKVLFGSDYPVLSPDRWMASFDEDLDIKPEVRPLIMKDNAIRVLGLA